MNPVHLLEELSNACGLPGDEGEVRAILRRALTPHVDEIYTDSIGNLICRKGSGPVRLMLDAHMDEVGLVVAGYDAGGLLRFKESGGIDARVLPGRAVLVGRAKLPGVIGLEAVHLTDEDDRGRVVPAHRLRIDIGARSREEAEAVAPPGTPVYFATRFAPAGGRLVRGKAFDDRIGCVALAETILDADYANLTLLAAFTVQEEIGLRGAQVAAYNLEPHLALAIDGTTAGDVPGIEPPQTCSHIGQGPAISLMDGTIITHERVRDHLVALAERHGIPHQFRRLTTAGTDAGAIFLQRAGVPACTFSVPCRYIHSPASLASLDDLEHTVRLIGLMARSLDEGEFRS